MLIPIVSSLADAVSLSSSFGNSYTAGLRSLPFFVIQIMAFNWLEKLRSMTSLGCLNDDDLGFDKIFLKMIEQ